MRKISSLQCIKEGCEKPQHTRGLCVKHYAEYKRRTQGIQPRSPQTVGVLQCIRENCENLQFAVQLCRKHYSETKMCNIDECEEPSNGQLCNKHQRERRATLICTVEYCENPQHCKRLCRKHYNEQKQLCIVDGCEHVQNAFKKCTKHYDEERALTAELCVIDGCKKLQHALRLCRKHYQENRLQFAPLCIVEDCENKQHVYELRLCFKHYQELRSREAGKHQNRPAHDPIKCAVETCNEWANSRGWCRPHYERWKKYDDVHEDVPIRKWGDVPGYAAAHSRIRQVKGSASDQLCEHCGDPAKQWAFNHNPTNMLIDIVRDRRDSTRLVEVYYSLDPNDYLPLCFGCHPKYDKANAASKPDRIYLVTKDLWTKIGVANSDQRIYTWKLYGWRCLAEWNDVHPLIAYTIEAAVITEMASLPKATAQEMSPMNGYTETFPVEYSQKAEVLINELLEEKDPLALIKLLKQN